MDVPGSKGFAEYARYINPLISQRARLAGEPWEIVRVEDGLLIDADGRRYEDFHGTQALNHRNPCITAAVQAFLETDSPNWYPSRVSPQAGRLARRLAERTGYDNSWFAASGSDVVESSIKLARVATKRTRILGLQGAYHGCGMGSMALMERGPFHDPFGPHVPDIASLPFGDTETLHLELRKGDVAAVIVEPIQGEGGVRVLPDAYVDALCALTAAHGTLLVADEIQTGLGRTGSFLRSSRWPRRPDMVLLGKPLAGGLLPLSVMLSSRELFLRAYGQDFEDGESHNLTFSYHALSAVAGLAALEVLDDALIDRVARVGAAFKADLQARLGDHPLVAEVRGEGLMLGLQLRPLDHPWLSFEHFGFAGLKDRETASPLLCHRLFRHGWFFFTCGHDWSIFRLQPRYAVPEETLQRVVGDIKTELDWLWETAQ